MGNTMGDLNNHLFAQLERLGDETMDADQTKMEIERARAMTGIAQQVIANANTVLRAAEFSDMSGRETPKMLTTGD